MLKTHSAMPPSAAADSMVCMSQSAIRHRIGTDQQACKFVRSEQMKAAASRRASGAPLPA